MSVTYGFYNSISGDRKYNATQMSSLFDGIINDGIFMSIGDKLIVSAVSGMNIIVGTGKAWFNHTWTKNDSELPLTVPESELVLNRIDSVILEINSNQDVRANSIKIVKGTPSSNPNPPTLIKGEFLNQYPLCNIYVASGVTQITQSNITNKVGTSVCPFVTGIIETTNIDELLTQWQSQFDDLKDEWAVQFTDWFNSFKDILDENTAANLLFMINQNISAIDSLEAITGTLQTTVSQHSTSISDLNSKVSSSILQQDFIKNATTIPTYSNGKVISIAYKDYKNDTLRTDTFDYSTFTNLLGTDGNCEDVSKWPGNVNGATISLDSSTKLFGNNSIKITSTTTAWSDKYLTLSVSANKYYFVSGYAKNYNSSNVRLQTGLAPTNSTSMVDFISSTRFERQGIKLATLSDTTAMYVQLWINTSSIGQYAWFDSIMVVEISSSDYSNLSVDQLMSKYPYIELTSQVISETRALTSGETLNFKHCFNPDGTLNRTEVN